MPEQDGALFSSSMEGQSSEGALALSLFPGFERSIEEFALTCFDLPRLFPQALALPRTSFP
ncbi:MAG TPA: hypothetical protein VIT18_05320 [Terrimicrobiaceae bacterium]